MPYVLSETIHYNPSGAKDALDKIRAFASSLGWTVDYWDTADGGGSDYYLQLWSPGYSVQEICYRFYITNVDAQEDVMSFKAVVPGSRYDQTNKIANTSTTWGSTSSQYYRTSLPASTFDALYLYGSNRFISAIFHVNSLAVITLAFGTVDLFPSWRNYADGLFYYWPPMNIYATGSSTTKWYNMNDNPTNWAPPTSTNWSIQGYHVWFEGAKRNSSYHGINFRPSSEGFVSGEFNKASEICVYNSFTSKRIAFQGTLFAKDPTAGVWYVIGLTPFAWINGTNLTIGEVIKFGSDEYRCFPGVFSTYPQWQAYRIS